MLKAVQYTLCILRLLRHIQVCSDATVWRVKLRRCVIALISLLSLLFLSSFLLNPGQSYILSISGKLRATSLHVPPVFLAVTLRRSMSSASRLTWSQSFNHLRPFTFRLFVKVSTSPFELRLLFIVVSILIMSYHGTIIRTGITCKNIPCYMRDSKILRQINQEILKASKNNCNSLKASQLM